MKVVRTIAVEVPNLGNMIRELRYRHKKKGFQLAQDAQMCYSNWIQIEKELHDTIPEDTLRRIEEALGCSFGVEFDGSED